MRTTKKLTITLFMTFSISMSMFSQAPSFSEHLEKAKQYEVEKLWIHALGEYYDAMELVPIDNVKDVFDNAKDVFQCWENLAETIESGNPGYGKFNDFDFVDNWIFLLQEYEKYWTHTAPKTFYFEKPERIELNRENRTATYKFGIKLIETDKFKEINAIVQKGLKKAYKEDWNIDLKNWPKESVYNDKKYGDKYLIEDTALASVKLARLNNRNYSSFDEESSYSPVKKNSGSHLVSPGAYWIVADEFQHSKKCPAFSCSVSTWTHIENPDYWGKKGTVSLYDIKFHVADKAGNVLLQSTRYNIPYEMKEDFRYEFKDVPQNTVQLIEDDEVDIIIDEVYLEYGKFDTYAVSGSRSYLKNLPELKIDNYTLNSWLTQKNDESIVQKLRQNIWEYERNKEAFEKSLERHLHDRDEVIHKGLEKKSYFQINYVIKIMPSMYFGGSYWENLSKKYGSKDATTVYYYLFCNKLSELENLEPVYKLQNQNETDKTYESEDVLFLENFENLICDTSASGWRLPTESEDSVLKDINTWYDLSTNTEIKGYIHNEYIIRNGDKEKAQFDNLYKVNF